jgi:septum formation protein
VTFPPLILASASPRRRELLSQLDCNFEVVPGHALEILDDNLTPFELCQLNAHRKARSVAKRIADALVLGADTLVFLEGEIFGKPATRAEAARMLTRLQGRTHQVVTGVSLIHLRRHWERLFAVTTSVNLKSLNPEQIENYLSKVQPLDKAGAYAIQEHGEMIISAFSGSLSNVVGLPLERLDMELRTWKAQFLQ